MIKRSGIVTDLLVGTVAGTGIGTGAYMLGRHLAPTVAIRSPEENMGMPMIQGTPAKPKLTKKAISVTVPHLLGAGAGMYLGNNVTQEIVERKRKKQIADEMATKEKELDAVLLEEQSTASGIPMAAEPVIEEKLASLRFDKIMESLGGVVYDLLSEKRAWSMSDVLNTPVVSTDPKVPTQMNQLMKLYQNHPQGPVLALLATVAALGGGVYGYKRMAAADPNRILKKNLEERLLTERLTGKDDLVGPMPVQLDSGSGGLQPLRRGAVSLVNPGRGRDVLEGI